MKRKIFTIFVISLMLIRFSISAEAVADFIPTPALARHILRIYSGLDQPTEIILQCDLDNDNRITASDARIILRMSAKLPTVETEETTTEQQEYQLVYLGKFYTTAYCPCYSCSEGWGRKTASGAIARANHTIAVDRRVIPLGTELMINGIIYKAEDVGGGVRGKHIDIFFNSHAETYSWGNPTVDVYKVVR